MSRFRVTIAMACGFREFEIEAGNADQASAIAMREAGPYARKVHAAVAVRVPTIANLATDR